MAARDPARHLWFGEAALGLGFAPASEAGTMYFDVVQGSYPHDVAAAPVTGGPVYVGHMQGRADEARDAESALDRLVTARAQ